jgi:hypothetical protein
MENREKLLKTLNEDPAFDAIQNNTIISALDPANPMYLLTFHSFFPQKIMFYSYGANFTLNVQFNGGAKTAHTLTPGTSKTIHIPEGTAKFDVDASDITILNPSFAGIGTTF